MSTTRKTITVTDQQDHWIKAQIAAGQFTNDSEYIRDLIRRDQARAKLRSKQSALHSIEAEESGEPQPFDGNLFKQEMIAKHGSKKPAEYRLAPKARPTIWRPYLALLAGLSGVRQQANR